MNAELLIMRFKLSLGKFLIFEIHIIIFLLGFASISFSQPEQNDSLTSVYENNLYFKPRLLIGSGLSTPLTKYDVGLRLFGSLNFRLCSDKKSWENTNISFFIEAGTGYFNTSLDRSDENSLILYFKFGPEIKIINQLFLCPAIGGLRVLNAGSETNNPFAVGLGLSLNYSISLAEKLNLEFEGGTNLFPANGGYPIWTPYLGIGVSID